MRIGSTPIRIVSLPYAPIHSPTRRNQLIARRCERGRQQLTSKRSASEWGTVSGDAAEGTAILDRLPRQGQRVTILGEIYRLTKKRRAAMLTVAAHRSLCGNRSKPSLAESFHASPGDRLLMSLTTTQGCSSYRRASCRFQPACRRMITAARTTAFGEQLSNSYSFSSPFRHLAPTLASVSPLRIMFLLSFLSFCSRHIRSAPFCISSLPYAPIHSTTRLNRLFLSGFGVHTSFCNLFISNTRKKPKRGGGRKRKR
ncbi:ATP-binding protein [Verrucomicrobium sp. 3C]|uniref:ATP-binding protein n=1 Tax=Verrucomicrobium sp. 3C TaxID=1134055 RepID=UPI0031B5A011